MRRDRLLKYAAVAAGGAVVLAVAVAAFLSMQGTFQLPSSTISSAPCTPQPCADVQGYVLWVSDLKITGGLVTMQLTFRNSSSSTHADPADLRVIDDSERASPPVYDAPGCTHWPRTDFDNGATFGPVPECFRPPDLSGPLTLRWSPDMGLICCQTDIALG